MTGCARLGDDGGATLGAVVVRHLDRHDRPVADDPWYDVGLLVRDHVLGHEPPDVVGHLAVRGLVELRGYVDAHHDDRWVAPGGTEEFAGLTLRRSSPAGAGARRR